MIQSPLELLFLLANGILLIAATEEKLFLPESSNLSPSHSDLLFLEIKESTLPVPNIGLGVFATEDIPSGELLCEFSGYSYNKESSQQELSPTQLIRYLKVDFEGEIISVIGDNVCSYINDCSWIDNPDLSLKEVQNIYNESLAHNIPTLPGYSYNARLRRTRLKKILIYSSTRIKAKTEICFFYGKVSSLFS
jgi:hypothetical protein